MYHFGLNMTSSFPADNIRQNLCALSNNMNKISNQADNINTIKPGISAESAGHNIG
jgi:hypothetical protein